MRNVFPKVTFKDGKYVATMLDKFGHQWATGEGDTRVAAIYDVRHKHPRQVLFALLVPGLSITPSLRQLLWLPGNGHSQVRLDA